MKQIGCAIQLIPTHPQRFVIPDKRSADPEPMPWTVMKQIGCAIQLTPSPTLRHSGQAQLWGVDNFRAS
jgi:hypothetical protein